jgi:hypothetical protein
VYQWAKVWREHVIDGITSRIAQRPDYYRVGRRQQRRIKQVLDLYVQGLKWSAIAFRL